MPSQERSPHVLSTSVTWRFVAVGVAATAAFFAAEDSRAAQGAIYIALSVAALTALAYGIRRNSPRDRTPWLIIMAGSGLCAAANVVGHMVSTFPSIADALLLVAYGFFNVGFLRLSRSTGAAVDRRTWVDTAIISVGIAVPSFVFIVEPFITFEDSSRLARAVLVAYPLMGMILMAAIVRLALNGIRSTSFWLLAVAFAGQVVADASNAFAMFGGDYVYGAPYFSGWMLSFVLLGAAALHPSMTLLNAPTSAEAALDQGRLVVLGATALIPSSINILAAITGTHVPVAGISLGSLLLFVLVFVRMSGLTAEASQRRLDLEVVNEKMVENALAVEMAIRSADKANAAKSQFLSRMSHELRTPLNAILGFSQLLEMDDLDPSQRESVRQIGGAGRHLLSLVNEVLDISKIEAGSVSLSIEPVDVESVVHEVADLVRPLIDARSLELTISITEQMAGAEVSADRQRLKQVLLNLLSNAIKYNRDAGRVEIACIEEGHDIRIEVSDTGPGLTEAQVARLFVAFDRLGAEATGTEGTGLGLALSRTLIEAMDGKLGVRSQPAQGSTFFVRLRRVPSPTVVGTPLAKTQS